MEKRRNYFLEAISPLFHNILLPVVRFPWTRFPLRDWLFEISEVEITRVDCTAEYRVDLIRFTLFVTHPAGVGPIIWMSNGHSNSRTGLKRS